MFTVKLHPFWLDTASHQTLRDLRMSESPDLAAPIPEPPSKEDLRLAMKAFRKRLKLTRLDDESRLGYGPMSGGGKSQVAAITPPDTFPKAVWQELAQQGKIRREGGGLYSLVE